MFKKNQALKYKFLILFQIYFWNNIYTQNLSVSFWDIFSLAQICSTQSIKKIS